jgi:hypothetical protein
MTQMIEAPKPKSSIPYFDPLASMYKAWVPDFKKVLEAQQKYIEGRAEYHTARELPLIKDDMRDIWLNTYETHTDNLKQLLVRLISGSYEKADPIGLLTSKEISPLALISKEFFLEALELVPEPENAVSAKEKIRLKKAAEKKMDAAKKAVSDHSPQGFLMLKSGEIKNDSRLEFVNFWYTLQGWLARPCGPRGIALELSEPDEKWAFEQLGIAKSISTKSEKLPYWPPKKNDY